MKRENVRALSRPACGRCSRVRKHFADQFRIWRCRGECGGVNMCCPRRSPLKGGTKHHHHHECDRSPGHVCRSKWYAVSAPFKALFTSWPECERAIKGVKGIKFKSFKTAEEARAFMDGSGAASRVRATCDSDTSSASAAPPPSSIDTLSAVAAAAHLEASSSAGGKRKRPLETGAQSHMPKPRKEARRSATLYYDGGSRGNPGISGAGAILYDAEGVEMWRGRKFVGRAATNNEAEYNGLILGLEAALVRGVTDMKVRGDSELVAKQMTGQYKVKSEKLESLHMIAKSLMKDFTSFEITNVPRAENSIADMLANEAMDLR